MAIALLTGATGFVGSHLLDQLLSRKYHVRCTVRATSSRAWLKGKSIEPVEVDLRTGRGLERAMDGVRVVFHVAGVLRAPSIKEFRAGNWEASKRVVEAAVAARAQRIVHVSSLAVAGPSPDGSPVDETTPCAPISLYGKTKLEGEREVWKHRREIGVTIVRPPVVYGPRDRGLYDLYKVLAAGVWPIFSGSKYVSIVHVEDLVWGLIEAAEDPRAAGEIFFLSNPRPYAYAELMGLMLAALERRALRVPVPDRLVRLLGKVADAVLPWVGMDGMFTSDKALEMTQKYWVCSAIKAKRVFDWEARIPIERGLVQTLAWYRAEKWL